MLEQWLKGTAGEKMTRDLGGPVNTEAASERTEWAKWWQPQFVLQRPAQAVHNTRDVLNGRKKKVESDAVSEYVCLCLCL